VGAFTQGRSVAALQMTTVRRANLMAVPNLIFTDDPRYFLILVPTFLVFVAHGTAHLLGMSGRMGKGARFLIISWLIVCARLYLSDTYFLRPT
jgi:hypothetical protein